MAVDRFLFDDVPDSLALSLSFSDVAVVHILSRDVIGRRRHHHGPTGRLFGFVFGNVPFISIAGRRSKRQQSNAKQKRKTRRKGAVFLFLSVFFFIRVYRR